MGIQCCQSMFRFDVWIFGPHLSIPTITITFFFILVKKCLLYCGFICTLHSHTLSSYSFLIYWSRPILHLFFFAILHNQEFGGILETRIIYILLVKKKINPWKKKHTCKGIDEYLNHCSFGSGIDEPFSFLFFSFSFPWWSGRSKVLSLSSFTFFQHSL